MENGKVLTKEELKAKKEKDAIAAMYNAKHNIEVALSRINTLESALSDADSVINQLIDFVPPNAYPRNSHQDKTLKEIYKEKKHAIAQHLQ